SLRMALTLALLCAGLAAMTNTTAQASTVPAGFSDVAVFTGLTLPTAVAFSPDGKVYVAEKSGIIKVFPSTTSNTPALFKDLRTRVQDYADRGLLGLAVDPR